MELTKSDLELIKEALNFRKKNIQEYTLHPDYDFKQKQLQEVDAVLTKLGIMIKDLK